MCKWFGLLIFYVCCTMTADTLLERFDELPLRGKLQGGATLQSDGGVERGALKATGNGKSFQYLYSYDLDAKTGETYRIALNYKTSSGQVPLLLMVVFEPPKGEKAPPSIYFKLPRTGERYVHRQFTFTVPAGVAKTRVWLRLAGAPETEWVLVDFLRLAPIVDGVAQGIDLTEFETMFDQWEFNRHLVFDHFMLGPGGAIVHEWKEAKVGEAFFRANGNGKPMQYPLYIDNLTVQPKTNYIFEAWIKATPAFRYNGNGMLIFFYKDKNGKALGQSRFHVRPTDGNWHELLHSFATPEQCAFVDIGLNIRNQPATQFIQLDHLRFHKGDDKAYLRYEIDPDKKELNAICAFIGSIKKEDITGTEFTVKATNGKEYKFTGELGITQNIDLKNLADDEYQLQAKITLKNGKTLSSDPQKFNVYQNPDWANDLGILKNSDTAPKPWRDLSLNDNTISTWGHLFEFSNNLGVRSLTGLNGETYLSAPVKFAIDGQDVFSGTKTQWKDGKSRITGSSAIKNKNWNAVLSCVVDYTGMLRYTLKLTAADDLTLQSGKLEIQTPQVDFIHRSDGSWTNVGAVDLNKEKIFTSKHFYNLQFGSLDRGICFYASSLYPRQMNYDKNWVTATQTGNLSIDFINAPFQLKRGETHTFDFAIAPYPFRPNESNWKKLRFRAGKNSNFGLLWPNKLMKYFGSLADAQDSAEMHKYLKSRKEYQLVYQIPTYIMDTMPQWSYFAKKWKVIPSRAYKLKESFGGDAVKGDFRQRTWTDLYIKRLVEAIREYNWDGIYYDCFGVDIFTENGESFMPFFELRDFQERVYVAQRLHRADSLTVSHVGADQANPLVAFSNVILMGEQYRGAFYKYTYFLEFMTLDEFRYENAVHVGPDRMLLPQYRQEEKVNNPAVAAHFMGISLLHNQMVYPNFIRKDVELSVRDRQYAFGMENASFFGYWKPNPDGIGTDNSVVPASYYKNEKGFFVTVLNSTDKPQEFTLKSDIPFSGAECFFPADGKSLCIKNGDRLKLDPYMSANITILK
ncbi:MAG: hypothetical protein PHV75_02105 [Victivallaceae bacterium]|nr:hypothetical protein [Victivallaceae bacterium]